MSICGVQGERRRSTAVTPLASLAAAGVCLLAGCASAQTAGSLTITYAITGSVQATGSFSHSVDAAHLCAAASLPALHAEVNGQPVEAPPGPPVYLIEFDPQAPASQPGALFKAFAYTPGMVAHSDPADDWIQININGQQWAGHGVQSAFQDSFTFDPGGLSGHLTAHGLLAHGPDGTVLPGQSVDLDATWRCPQA